MTRRKEEGEGRGEKERETRKKLNAALSDSIGKQTQRC